MDLGVLDKELAIGHEGEQLVQVQQVIDIARAIAWRRAFTFNLR